MSAFSHRLFGIVTLVIAATMMSSANGQDCPEVAPIALNTTEFIAKSWFIQKQQTVPYQTQDDLYCVVATYNRDTSNENFVLVSNSAKTDGVDGDLQDGADLCAELLESGMGRLRVAPCFLRKIGVFGISAGPYWVVAVDEEYNWAIISGGPLTEPRANGTCTTKSSTTITDTNGSGLWLFSRVPTGQLADEHTETMLEKLDELGIYPGDLNDVTQEGCDYSGQSLKPPRVIGEEITSAPTVPPTVDNGAEKTLAGNSGAVMLILLSALSMLF